MVSGQQFLLLLTFRIYYSFLQQNWLILQYNFAFE